MGLGAANVARSNRAASREQAAASDRAATLQYQAAAEATAEQRRQYDLARQDQMPWLQSGQSALGRLDRVAAGDMSQFFTSPDYNFRRSEGQRDIGNSFAARGGAASGNALRALSEFNSNLASGEFGNWWNRTASQAGVGQTTASNLGSLGANAASNIGNINMGAATNAGQFGIAGANARASGLRANAQLGQQMDQNALNIMGYFMGGR